MEENKNQGTYVQSQDEVGKKQLFDFSNIFATFILNWQWFLAATFVCIVIAFAYNRYSTPYYSTTAKLLIKEEDNNSRMARNSLAYATNLGFMTNSAGIDNEMEILKSVTISKEAVKQLKMYVSYYAKGNITTRAIYKTQAINVDMNAEDLKNLKTPISLEISPSDNGYRVKGKYKAPIPEDTNDTGVGTVKIDEEIKTLPARIRTKWGVITLSRNGRRTLENTLKTVIVSPLMMGEIYANKLKVTQSAKTTTIAVLTLKDAHTQRALDYLSALVQAYNDQANEDKNEIALRTEDFINGRLEKISDELGNTEGSMERFKKINKVIELELSAKETMTNASSYNQKLVDINMQIALINNLATYINDENNKYQVIPSNVGLEDINTQALINNYNKLSLERSTLLRTAGEVNPAIKPLTHQLDDIYNSIKQAMSQAKKSLEIQKSSISTQYNKYQGQILSTPEQERVMNSIGRQQEVQTALYTMLLQKREENSISLAATANKGKLIDRPSFDGVVKTRSSIVYLIALFLGFAIPFVVISVINYMKYKIESHEDIAAITNIPIIADVPVANDKAKTIGELVVHENENNMMEEIFRGMRTNLQFMLTEGQKVILTTSSIAGEGKTFIAANLAVSFALLGKKVILIGLDIRKPRLSELFQLSDHTHGITNLLAMTSPNEENIKAQIVNSRVNKNLDLLMAGPVPPNPAEMLERSQLETVINTLKQTYDYIIIDTAPVGLVTDTLNISRVANVTIAVSRDDYTPKENIAMIDELNKQGKLKNTCIVFNGIDMSKKKNSYYYGYGRYGRYGNYGRHYTSYGRYGSSGTYGYYGNYGNYSNSRYSNKNDNSIKL